MNIVARYGRGETEQETTYARAGVRSEPLHASPSDDRRNIRQWNKREQLYDREIKWQLYNENVKLQIAHIRTHKQR